MISAQIEQKSYEMPPRGGFTVTHFITVADIDRSADFYEKVFGMLRMRGVRRQSWRTCFESPW
jgi:predicted enzyme related to lactoylglutathione lyase